MIADVLRHDIDCKKSQRGFGCHRDEARRFNFYPKEWVKEAEERIKRRVVEVCICDARENTDVGDVIKVGMYAFERDGNQRDEDEGQRKPEYPFPVAFQQKGKHERGGRRLQMDGKRKSQRGKKNIFWKCQQAVHNQRHDYQIHLHISERSM